MRRNNSSLTKRRSPSESPPASLSFSSSFTATATATATATSLSAPGAVSAGAGGISNNGMIPSSSSTTALSSLMRMTNSNSASCSSTEMNSYIYQNHQNHNKNGNNNNNNTGDNYCHGHDHDCTYDDDYHSSKDFKVSASLLPSNSGSSSFSTKSDFKFQTFLTFLKSGLQKCSHSPSSLFSVNRTTSYYNKTHNNNNNNNNNTNNNNKSSNKSNKNMKYNIKYYIKRYIQIFILLFMVHITLVSIYNTTLIPDTCHVAQLSREQLKLLNWIGRDVDYILVSSSGKSSTKILDRSGVNEETKLKVVKEQEETRENKNQDGNVNIDDPMYINNNNNNNNNIQRNSDIILENNNGDENKDNSNIDLSSLTKTPSTLNTKKSSLRNGNKKNKSKEDINRRLLLPEGKEEHNIVTSTMTTTSTNRKAAEDGILATTATATAASTSITSTNILPSTTLPDVATTTTSTQKEAFNPTLPKIIHHQWKDQHVPTKYLKWYKKWKIHYPEPEYQHILWTDDSARSLIATHYTWFLDTYDNYDKNIKRADSARYFILHFMGGIYADLDYEPMTNFYDYLPQNQAGLIESPYLYNERTQNSFMSSPKGDPFWLDVFSGLAKNAHRSVLNATGPKFLDRMIDSTKHPVYTLPCENFHRIPYGELNESKWMVVFARELVTRVVPMSKHCGFFRQENSCQFGKHHNIGGWTSESFF